MKPFNEMIDDINSGLETKIKMSYKLEKSMKKTWGKYKAFEIAFGRKVIKLIKDMEKRNDSL